MNFSPNRRQYHTLPLHNTMMKLAAIAAVTAGLAAWKPDWFAATFRRLERILARLARHPRLAVLLVGVLSFGINAGLTRVVGRSSPHIHDEFANLLAADTFLHGRLCNPAHPFAEFFESIHVLCEPLRSAVPVYASKYPPAQGLMLAAGQLVGGDPVVGLWLSVALACAALCWALMAWLPPRWGLLGGLLFTLHPMLLKWGQVYWGGAEALLGGALLAGAFRRLVIAPRAGNSLWLGVGMVVLALSRPFEGMVASLLVLAGLAGWIIKRRHTLQIKTVRRLFTPVAVVMGLYFGWQGYYNARFTGSPLKLPYMAYEERYAVAPFLVWQKPRPEPKYNHDLIRRHFVEYATQEYQAQQSPGGFLKESAKKILRLARDYTGRFFALAIPLLALPWVWRRGGWNRFAIAVVAVFGLVTLQETWMWDRYAAPIGGLFFALVLLGLRQLSVWQPLGRPYGRALVVLILLAFLGQTALWLKLRRWENTRHDWDWQREQMIADLKKQGGQHLILVRYGPKQSVHDDWVHNGADLHDAPILWGRDMGPEQNRRLLDHYANRKIWLLESELPVASERDQMKTPPQHRLVPYTP